jgi:hypothetical protein
MSKPTLAADDLAYISRNCRTLEAISAGAPRHRSRFADGELPRPSYVLDDGTA